MTVTVTVCGAMVVTDSPTGVRFALASAGVAVGQTPSICAGPISSPTRHKKVVLLVAVCDEVDDVFVKVCEVVDDVFEIVVVLDVWVLLLEVVVPVVTVVCVFPGA